MTNDKFKNYRISYQKQYTTEQLKELNVPAEITDFYNNGVEVYLEMNIDKNNSKLCLYNDGDKFDGGYLYSTTIDCEIINNEDVFTFNNCINAIISIIDKDTLNQVAPEILRDAIKSLEDTNEYEILLLVVEDIKPENRINITL